MNCGVSFVGKTLFNLFKHFYTIMSKECSPINFFNRKTFMLR